MSGTSVVVVTGASSGIGRATALRFAKSGHSLVLASRRAEALRELVEECESLGATAISVPTDVSDEHAVQALGRAAEKRFGRIDVWANVAGTSVFGTFTEVPLTDFRRVIDVNMYGAVYGSRVALDVFTRQGHGVLINVSSILGEVPQPYTAAYCRSKAAINALDVTLRSELALQRQKKIHVVTVMPATIDTPFFRHAANYTGRRPVAMPPVYSPDLVARKIVAAVGRPRPEIVVGALGKTLVRQHRRTPRPVEAQLSAQTEAMQLSHKEMAPLTAGTLYATNDDPRDAEVTGGWHGKARNSKRNLLVGALGVGLLALVVNKSRHSSR
ncbi:SDR family oxidoreductase [Agreia sp. Leaf210]|uniref:SDR family oxidoreductase n=1 Tax=Agreia sp. Leaf210 TaxID=1735682 RepID=UPI0006F6DC7D|nr:SDR family oxidoreductase [Agreia sp. Leaf210]KQM57492.1 short-chain dehydrogenase [Agreia sp. Leaf210]